MAAAIITLTFVVITLAWVAAGEWVAAKLGLIKEDQ